MVQRGVALAQWVREALLFLPYCPPHPTRAPQDGEHSRQDWDVHDTLQPVWPGADH